MEPITIEKIRALLPHRYPFLLVDRILDHDEEKGIVVALKNVTANENYFQGHFPDQPVMPGVLILEALAQVCGMVFGLSAGAEQNDGRVYLLVSIDKVRFKKPVVPGDQVILKASVKRKINRMWKFDCVATVDDEVCCSAEIMCTYKEDGE